MGLDVIFEAREWVTALRDAEKHLYEVQANVESQDEPSDEAVEALYKIQEQYEKLHELLEEKKQAMRKAWQGIREDQ